jgi:hypothetical protein
MQLSSCAANFDLEQFMATLRPARLLCTGHNDDTPLPAPAPKRDDAPPPVAAPLPKQDDDTTTPIVVKRDRMG